MADTSIEWTDATWNPVRWLLGDLSPAARTATRCGWRRRLDAMGVKKYRGLTRKSGKRAVWTGKVRLDREALDIPAGWKKPRRIIREFDVGPRFHEAVPAEFVAAVWRAMQANQAAHLSNSHKATRIGWRRSPHRYQCCRTCGSGRASRAPTISGASTICVGSMPL